MAAELFFAQFETVVKDARQCTVVAFGRSGRRA